jgi:hypothetical protein
MMGKVTGFKEFDRKTEDYRPVELRLKDYGEIFTGTHNIGHLQEQGARCMDCIFLIVTAGLFNPNTQEPSQGAGQTRPVNSGKLLVLCRRINAACH